jgi:hypothetical protein
LLYAGTSGAARKRYDSGLNIDPSVPPVSDEMDYFKKIMEKSGKV